MTLSCPRCGSTTAGAGLADDADVCCPECGLVYSPADGNIWNVTVAQAVEGFSAYVGAIADRRGLHPKRFKAAIMRGLQEAGWGDEQPRWSAAGKVGK